MWNEKGENVVIKKVGEAVGRQEYASFWPFPNSYLTISFNSILIIFINSKLTLPNYFTQF